MQARRPRGVLAGAVLLAVGVTYLLPYIGVRDVGAVLFVMLGLAFAAAYAMGTHAYAHLAPAGVLLGFGMGLLLPAVLEAPQRAEAPIFLAALGAGLLAVFLLAPQRRWPLVPAGLLAVLALLGAFGQAPLMPDLALLVPLILVGIGVYLLLEPRA